jgi:hypothetical protein
MGDVTRRDMEWVAAAWQFPHDLRELGLPLNGAVGAAARRAMAAIRDNGAVPGVLRDVLPIDAIASIMGIEARPYRELLEAAPHSHDDDQGPDWHALLTPRPCNVSRLREREHLQFVPLAELPEGHGMGEVFDESTGGGLAPGSLVGIGAAGTGAGKTALLMQILDGMALRSALAATDPEAAVPLTPVAIFSEMAADDLEVRTLGRLLDVPGTVFAAGRSARRWHKWAWVDDQFNRAAALMEPGATYHRIAAWQRYTRAGSCAGPSFVRAAEAAVAAWVEEIAARYPGREIVPVLAIDPVNSFLPLDGRSEVETLGELTALLDELADRRRWICAFTAETNKTSAVAAGNGNTGGTAAAVFRGTMQLLHRCDLALVLEAGDPDPDGVRPVTLTFDKNRSGRTGISTAFRWHTRTGLRFVPETKEEHDGHRVGDASFPTPESLAALCVLVERLQTANEKVTDTKLRGLYKDIGVVARDVPRLILAAIERKVLRRTGEKARGGGNGPLTTAPEWQETLAWRDVHAPKSEPVQTGANP